MSNEVPTLASQSNKPFVENLTRNAITLETISGFPPDFIFTLSTELNSFHLLMLISDEPEERFGHRTSLLVSFTSQFPCVFPSHTNIEL
mmetsp:Transcript_251/g.553  ORF Transcript_251/g.553 Transcript_251/m.553 type:complete len:89 (-) Transcript_251:75-341(-)